MISLLQCFLTALSTIVCIPKRSRLDADYGSGSEFVLYPVDGRVNDRETNEAASSPDHVTTLGFRNDGYDYEQVRKDTQLSISARDSFGVFST
jgi:hypothetical protein